MASPKPESAGQPLRIQPHGFLIEVSPEWRIVRTSANIVEFLGDICPSPIGHEIAQLLGDSAVHTLRNRLSLLRDPQGSARAFALQVNGPTPAIDVAMHLDGGDVVIEGQPATGQDSGDPIGLVRALASRLDGKRNHDEMLAEGARQLRALTGFDRVTLFRWNPDGVTEIAAHCARGDLAAAPTPVHGCLRLIVDSGVDGIAVEPSAKPALFERCLLNIATTADRDSMGTAASLVRIPLVASGIEWGVAVCLNQTPRQLGLERFASAELFSDLLALRLALLEARA